MTTLMLGFLILLITLVLLATGVPVAFALGGVSAIFLLLQGGSGDVASVAEAFFGALEEFNLVAIPMFILMGAAAAASRVGGDIGEALKRWLHPVAGGKVLASLGAAAVFAGVAGSSPATCVGIGRKSLPEMLGDGYPKDIAGGSLAAAGTLAILIPPSLVLIVYGIAANIDIGRLFLAGMVPGLLLLVLFMALSLFILRRHHRDFHDGARRYSMREKLEILPRTIPILLVIAGVIAFLIAGIVEPSEAGGVGALLVLCLIVFVYGVHQRYRLWSILQSATRESVMILMIIAGAAMFGAMLSELGVPVALSGWIYDLALSPWMVIIMINLLLLLLGCFMPPVAVVLMSLPVVMPVVIDAGYDPVWFAIVMTLNLQIGLITPPVGLNLQAVRALAPDLPRDRILRGAWPFLLCIAGEIVLLCLFPEIATALPDALMGPTG